MTLRHPQLHIYICDHAEGRLSEEIRPLFEAFLRQHPYVSSFVDKAMKGRELLTLYRAVLKTPAGA